MLKVLFAWLDQHPNSYWLIVAGPTLLLGGWICRLGWRSERDSGKAGWRDALILFLFLFAWRWPFLLVADDLNPDESQLIAGALTLSHDPVFWRSVDGTTSGPLNFYVLLPMHWLGLPLDYFSARLTGLLLLGGSLFLCLRSLTTIFGRTAAWLGVLPAVAFFATATNSDLIHFSSEHLPLLAVAVAAALLAGRRPDDRIRLWLACFLAGAMPLAKLQAAPLGLVLIGWGLWQVFRDPADPLKSRLVRTGGIVLSAALPILLTLVMLIATGQTETAGRRYFLHNVIYVENAAALKSVLDDMARVAMADGRLPLLLGTAIAILTIAGAYFLRRRLRPPGLMAAAGWLMLAAIIAIFTPRRGYIHYLLLLIVPLTLGLGAAIGGWWRQLTSTHARRVLAGVLVFGGGLLPVLTRCLQPVPAIYGDFTYHWRHPRTSAAEVVHALAGREDSLGVWGWANFLYVETGLPQATRDPHSTWSILPNAQRDYHRAIYLADLRRHQPAVFVDAVGPAAFAYEDRPSQAHETFPELAEYIRQNYALVTDLGEVRIYARKDLAALPRLEPNQLDRLIGQGRMRNHDSNAVPPPLNPSQSLPRKVVGRQSVVLLLPPARMEWPLDQEVREVSLVFGFDPVAYLQGASNGAEVILELVNHEQTRPVYRRLLDPVRAPSDRELQTVRIILPPFGPGTHLLLRTGPGPFDDSAWDWVYLAGLQFRRSPAFLPEQFPGFNRVPDSADAELSFLQHDAGGNQLHLHAPVTMTFGLSGRERQLQFDYGLLPGAYSNGGRTDGAVFRVELQSPGAPDRRIFERYLQPVADLADRGRQHALLLLPLARPGDRLVVRIDTGPAGNGAWDWTYVSRLTLE